MNGQVRWGVLGGTSWIARDAIMPGIRKSRNGKLVATASRDPNGARRRFGDEPGVKIVSYDDLLADPDIDAIYIPLPNSMHGDWAIKCAAAGKPVLCEKPLGLDVADTMRIAAAFQKARLPLMESFMYRFHPQHARVRKIIDSGAIGDVLEVRSHLSNNMMSPPDPKNVRLIPELGGGVLLDMGCYEISLGDTIRQALAAGVLDQLDVHVVPAMLGSGERLFGGTANVRLEQDRVIAAPRVTHLRYRVVR